MYPGSAPFEATEAAAFSDWVRNTTSNTGPRPSKIVGIIDLHSYSQQILYPYSYSCTHQPRNLEDIQELAVGLAKTIRLASGERYEVASACDSTGIVGFPGTSGSGSMIDYMHAVEAVPFTYQIKLRDTGNHGFLLPKTEIVPTGEEMWGVLKYLSVWLSEDQGPTSVHDDLRQGLEL